MLIILNVFGVILLPVPIFLTSLTCCVLICFIIVCTIHFKDNIHNVYCQVLILSVQIWPSQESYGIQAMLRMLRIIVPIQVDSNS